jgi:hypothetical protein
MTWTVELEQARFAYLLAAPRPDASSGADYRAAGEGSGSNGGDERRDFVWEWEDGAREMRLDAAA